MRAARWIALLLIVVLTGLFAYFNAGERTTLSLGFTVLYRISLVRLVLGSFLLGMVTMFLIGLRQDMQLRRLLRERDRPKPHASEREVGRYEPSAQRWTSPASAPPALDPD